MLADSMYFYYRKHATIFKRIYTHLICSEYVHSATISIPMFTIPGIIGPLPKHMNMKLCENNNSNNNNIARSHLLLSSNMLTLIELFQQLSVHASLNRSIQTTRQQYWLALTCISIAAFDCTILQEQFHMYRVAFNCTTSTNTNVSLHWLHYHTVCSLRLILTRFVNQHFTCLLEFNYTHS